MEVKIFDSIVVSVLTGSILGVMEGAIYPLTGGPRLVPLFIYWCIMIFILWRLQVKGYAISVLPVALVFQDMFSLFFQYKNPITEDWYSAVFGHNIFTYHTIGVPNWYGFAILLSILLLYIQINKGVFLSNKFLRKLNLV